MLIDDYLSEEVNYGGLMVSRGEMIADLQRCAASFSDDPMQRAMFVSRYLQGRDQYERGLQALGASGFAAV